MYEVGLADVYAHYPVLLAATSTVLLDNYVATNGNKRILVLLWYDAVSTNILKCLFEIRFT